MNIMLIALLSLFLCCTSQVTGQVSVQTPEQFLKSGSLKMGSDSIESLPIYYQKNSLVFIKVFVDGKEYLFLFDSGASGCLISTEIAGNAKVENTIPVEDDLGNEIKANVVLKNIQIGKSSFNNIACMVGNTRRLSELGCVKLDGIIGANVLKFCNWKIDPTTQTLSFSKTAFEKQNNSHEFDIEFTNGYLPLIKFSYDGISFYTLVDSGFSDYFELNDDVLKKSKKYRKLNRTKGYGQHSLTISSIVNGNVDNLFIDTLKSNDAFILHVPAMINQSKPKLGSATLRRYIFTYNFAEKKIFFTPIPHDTSSLLTFNVNLGLNDSNQLIINFIWLNEETKKLGLKVGQKITKIDDQPVNQLSYDDLCELKRKLEAKNKIRLSVMTGTKIKEFDLFKTTHYPTN